MPSPSKSPGALARASLAARIWTGPALIRSLIPSVALATLLSMAPSTGVRSTIETETVPRTSPARLPVLAMRTLSEALALSGAIGQSIVVRLPAGSTEQPARLGVSNESGTSETSSARSATFATRTSDRFSTWNVHVALAPTCDGFGVTSIPAARSALAGGAAAVRVPAAAAQAPVAARVRVPAARASAPAARVSALAARASALAARALVPAGRASGAGVVVGVGCGAGGGGGGDSSPSPKFGSSERPSRRRPMP